MPSTPLPAFLGPARPLTLTALAATPLVATRGDVPGFSMTKQAHSNWCWAAVTDAVLALAGLGKGQDAVATDHIQANGQPGGTCVGAAGLSSNGLSCAATPNCGAGCNDTHIIRYILSEQGQYRSTLSSGGAPPSYQQIQAEVARLKPVIVVINWPPVNGRTLGHFIAVTGWQVAAGKQYVEVFDPANASAGTSIPVATILYSDLVSHYALSGAGGKAVFSYSVN